MAINNAVLGLEAKDHNVATTLNKVNKSLRETEAQTKRLKNATNKLVDEFHLEGMAVGKTADEIKLLKLEQMGATNAQIQAAKAAMLNRDAMMKGAGSSKIFNGQMRLMRGGLGQVGHQIQDVAVQLQMGQNAMLVFGQQGGQIASLFGQRGAIIGAILAVGAALATTFASGMIGASKVVKELEDSTESLVDKYDELSDSLKRVARAVATNRIEKLREAIKDANDEIAHQSIIFASAELGAATHAKTIQEASDEIDNQRDIIVLANAEIDRLTKKTDDSSDAFERMDKKLQDEINTFGLGARAIEIYNIKNSKMSQKEKDAAIQKTITLDRLEQEVIKREAAIKATEESAQAYKDEKKALEDLEEALASFFDKEFAKKDAKDAREKKALEARIEALKTSLLSERALLDKNYQDDLSLIDKGIKDETEKNNIMLKLREKYLADIKALDNDAAGMKDQEKAIDEFKKSYKPMFDEFGDGFVDAISGAENFADSMKKVAKSVVDSLIRIAVQKLIVDKLFNVFVESFGPISSTSTSSSNPVSMDGGGFTGRGPRSGGVDGKGGFAAILHPNETVIDHTKGQSNGIIVQQTINVTTGVQQTVRAEIVQLMPQIAQAAKGAVADARLRGGNFSKAMSGA